MAKKKQKSKSTSKRRSTLTAPTRPTVKRLFAVSGNRCAFKRCATPIVDKKSGSILGEICHIKGEKPGAKRYDKSQLSSERHDFANLILLCSVHHKIIDDDDVQYSVEVLRKMKASHERRQQAERISDRLADQMITRFKSTKVRNGSIISTREQTGGQVAHSIKNVYNCPHVDNDRIQIVGLVRPVGDLTTIKRFGSAGVQFTVVNRGVRPAKIARAQFCVEGEGFVAAMEKGFERKFEHKPPPGLEKETLYVTLFSRSEKTCADGFVLQRDDVSRFFLPFGAHIGPALDAEQEDVYFRVVFFDGSKEVLVRGKLAKDVISDAVDVYGGWPFKPKRRLALGIEAKSAVRPKSDFDMLGMANPKSVWLGKPGTEPSSHPLEFEMSLLQTAGGVTLLAKVGSVPQSLLKQVNLKFCVVEQEKKTIYVLEFARVEIGNDASVASFAIPMEHRDKAIRVARDVSDKAYWLSVCVDTTEIGRFVGEEIKPAFEALEKHLKESA